MMAINRCDILEDTGMAISPEVDIGQVEGGLIMGLGLWTSEKVFVMYWRKYNKK